ncbi:MAG TPA: hypothetical protein DCQ31_05030 [Bacteroidales bacterium]|nr:hypothetical protein [Bacteroidales bacterium]
MKLVRKLKFFCLAIGFHALFASTLFAQDIQFKAVTEKMVEMGESFQLVFELNARPEGFTPPSLADFNFNGPMQGSQSSTSIVNGKVTQSSSYTFTYVLQPKKAGKFTIGAAKAIVKGKEYSTQPVVVEVVGNGQASTGTTSGGNTQNGNSDASQGMQEGETEDLFVRIELNKTKAYVGEQLVATLKLYTRVSVVDFDGMKFPTYKGFFAQDIETTQNITFNREQYNGKVYNAGVLRQVVLTPQQAGELTIDAFELGVVSQKRVPPQSFFDNGLRNFTTKLISPKRKVTVMALPANKPADFSGGTGTFTMNVTVSKESLPANEALSMKVVISGTGNLKLINPPQIQFPADFEVYSPNIVDDIKTDLGGSKGTKTIEYTIIPRFEGEYTIPAFSFSYFDIKKGTYETLSSKEYVIKVTKGSASSSQTVVSNLSKEDVKIVGSDIRYIKNESYLKKRTGFLVESFGFYSVYIISTVLFLIILILYRKKVRENANLSLVRNRQAGKVSRKRLKTAAAFMAKNDASNFYTEILNALWLYISDKLSIPLADLTKERAMEALAVYITEKEELSQFEKLADTCEFAKFAPGSVSGNLKEIYSQAEKTIELFEKKIKK